ncbi:TonB-dependent receptor domain-containing protein [Microbulbifer elongatus]|uniref:TonB-dependent receptor domain-containing protein n=1 Tax=Microbulbifer elongatus TaxID=86173 RepID=UPI001CFF40F1|nr:TonB-dependent receptor [Microbulbifer elongatus]
MNNSFKKSLIALAVSASFCAPVFAADDTRGFLRGNVSDIAGTSVEGTSITITNRDLGLTRTVQVDADGMYRFPALVTGTYDIVVSRDGQVVTEQKGVVVGLGGKTQRDIVLGGDSTIEELEVLGKVTTIDTSSAVKDFVVNTDELTSRVPIARDLTSVALLAPGTQAADRTFAANNHDEASISMGGASAAENACFVNGLNITNFRNGLGCSQVPFQMFENVQVKGGGYNAEFGRAIGGVMNATTKRGSNEFETGINFYYEPDALRSDSPNTYAAYNDEDERSSTNVDLWASGAIIQDKLFYYALYSPQKRESVDAGLTRAYKSEWDNDFWGLKLDYIIADGHTLEYTGFDDTREEVETTYLYDRDAGGFGDEVGETTYSRGGENHIFKYTGIMTDWMTLSGQYGINEYARTDAGELDGNPLIIDQRSGTALSLGNWGNSVPSAADDERKAWRIDADFYVGDHTIRAGIDSELNTAVDSTMYSGGIYYRYYEADANNKYVASGDLNAGDEYVRVRNLQGGGTFETESSAFYIQDEWAVNDQLTLHFGLRNESFDNKNAEGQSFIKIDDQWAPRLGVSFDPTGDYTSRVYANYGRYYIPIAANTNIRMAAAELFTEDYYVLNGLNTDDTAIYDPSTLFDSSVFGDGTVPDTRSVLDENIEPMYQDELIVGYEFNLNDEWNLGVRGVYRDLKSTIEDIAIDAAVIDHYNTSGTWDTSKSGTCSDGNGGTRPCTVEDVFSGFHQYVLTNPGADMSVYITEMDETVSLSAAQLGYPEASRTYKALEFTFDREWDGQWMMGGSLVLASLKGNHEGYVKSDNGQDDAGITTSFDQPGLTQYSYGYLPSDQRWTAKLWGNYRFENGLSLGANFVAEDGRPVSCIGNHPTDVFAELYGAESFYCGGEPSGRGKAGRTSDTYNIDVAAQYTVGMGNGSEVVLRADVFNLFDFDTEVEVRELGELDNAGTQPDPNFLKPTSYQYPRSVRLSASYNF